LGSKVYICYILSIFHKHWWYILENRDNTTYLPADIAYGIMAKQVINAGDVTMRVVIAGPKGSGKSTIAQEVSLRLGLSVVETDDLIEDIYAEDTGSKASCREICLAEGEPAFRKLEHRAVEKCKDLDWRIICTGGAALVNPESRRILRNKSIIVLLTADKDILWERMKGRGLPPFYSGDNGFEVFTERLNRTIEIIYPYSDVCVDTTGLTPVEVAQRVTDGISEEMATRTTEPNTIGEAIRVSTFGESHGPAIGSVLDGVPPGLELSEEDIQAELDRRRPGQSSVTTPRNEPDRVRILSGVFEGKTTGAPICFVIENTNQDSGRYDYLREIFRPGHADFTFWRKFAIRDHRGGGRSSGRETAGRVAGGTVARKILAARGVTFTAHALELGGIRAESFDINEIERNPVRCADANAAPKMIKAIESARDDGDSVGGIIELRINGVPAGLGDPVFNKLDALIGRAILSLGAVKGFEIGSGFSCVKMRGSQHNDPIRSDGFMSNNAGGILGGISTGQEILIRVAIKPTASVSTNQLASTIGGDDIDLSVLGRHDPCIIPRVIPVIESMAALVVLDLWETQNRLRPDWEK